MEFEVNDLNYEDKLQEDRFLYSNIAFNLAADAGGGSQQCVGQASWKLPKHRTSATNVPQAGLVLGMWDREKEGWHKDTAWYGES